MAETNRVSIATEKQITDENGSLKSLYSSLETQRQVFLQRARDAAELTIPMLMPPQGHTYATTYATPYQSVGARGVNNLASKLLLALLPPNAPFFRLAVDEVELRKQMPQDESGAPPTAAKVEELKTEMEKALSKIENLALRDIEASSIRVGTFEGLRQLLVSGNVLLYLPDDGGMRVFRLDSYGVKRDPSGNVTHIVAKERVAKAALPEDLRTFLEENKGEYSTEKTDGAGKDGYDGLDNFCELYTGVCRNDEGGWDIWQEINGMEVPESRGTYAEDKNPWLALRLNRVDNEDYGRGFVEEYIGDLKALEALSQGVVEATAAASKVVFLVDPTGTTRVKTLADAKNGAFVSGKATDVTTLQVEKRADLSIVNSVIQDITQRLSFAFLLNTAIQRQAERVTAEEIRYMAQELESSLGGAYSILSQEFQLPLIKILLTRLIKDKRLPDLPKKLIQPIIITGVEALGRGNDLQKLDLFIQGMAQTLGPTALQYINVEEYLNRRAAALGIVSEGLIKSQDEIDQQSQQQQQMDMVNKLGPAGIQAMTKVATATPEAANKTYQGISGQQLPPEASVPEGQGQ
jgi:hypothetical protein